MFSRVAVVRTDVSEERIISIFRLTRIGEIGITLAANRNIVVFLRSLLRLLVTANVVSSSPILVTLMIEAIHSSEMSVLTKESPRHIPEEGILDSHRCENLKSCTALTGWTL
jgi:hypothetical protein